MTRAPDPKGTTRETFMIAHVLFELCDHPEHGVTFGLRPRNDPGEAPAKLLFAAHVPPRMAEQMRIVADRLDELEAKLTGTDDEDIFT